MDNNTNENVVADSNTQVTNTSVESSPVENQNEKVETTSSSVATDSSVLPKKKSNKVFPIILMLVGIIGIVCGVVLGKDDLFGNEKDKNKTEEKTGSKQEENAAVNTVKAYSEYKTYQYIKSVFEKDFNAEGATSTVTSRIDNNNGLEYMVYNFGVDSNMYVYNDYKNKKAYLSYDDNSWTASDMTSDVADSINLSVIIDKINSNDSNVTKIDANNYEIVLDFDDGYSKYKNVKAKVQISDGFVSSISFDFTNADLNENVEVYNIDVQLNSINSSNGFSLPSSISSQQSSQPTQDQNPTVDNNQNQEEANGQVTTPQQDQNPVADNNTQNNDVTQPAA